MHLIWMLCVCACVCVWGRRAFSGGAGGVLGVCATGAQRGGNSPASPGTVEFALMDPCLLEP